ncbi:MAG: BlaI/MecI/CopY family transcriptional regulator [Candidatus Dormibacteria bacterium]
MPSSPLLAYTTLMTTLNRLAHKGLLAADRAAGHRAHSYRPKGTPADYLACASRHQVELVLERFGESAHAAFAARLHVLPRAEHEELRKMAHGQ